METTTLARKFIYKNDNKETVSLPDPNPAFTPAEVIQFYASQHPHLTTATIDGPRVENDAMVYEFKTTVGTKG